MRIEELSRLNRVDKIMNSMLALGVDSWDGYDLACDLASQP